MRHGKGGDALVRKYIYAAGSNAEYGDGEKAVITMQT